MLCRFLGVLLTGNNLFVIVAICFVYAIWYIVDNNLEIYIV